MGKALQDGHLGLDINTGSVGTKVFILSVFSICLFIQTAIGLTAWNKMTHAVSIGKVVNVCFTLCFVSAFTFTLCAIVYHSWDPFDEMMASIFRLIEGISLGLFFELVLLTYIVRLHITFKSSEYAMSTILIVVFVFIMMMSWMGWILVVVMVLYTDSAELAYIVCVLCIVLYLMGVALAVYFFVFNLSKLIKSRVTTPDLVPIEDDVKLSRNQQKWSELSSKYTMLFGFTITSTTLSFLVMHSVHLDLRGPFITFDFCVNLWCLYLQFAFAKRDYMTCCRHCDRRCRNLGLKRTRRAVHRHSIELGVTYKDIIPNSNSDVNRQSSDIITVQPKL